MELRANDLLWLLLQMIPQSTLYPPSPEAALRSAGAHLRSLGSCGRSLFRDAVRDAWLSAAVREIERAEETLALHASSPDYWAADVERLIEGYESSISAGLPPLMVDISGSPTPEESLKAAQAYVLRHGRLLSAWPDIYEAAASVRKRSSEAAVPSGG